MHSSLYRTLQPAKPSRYLGVTYRSRAEAKWALVMTMLRVPFYYEPSMVKLHTGWYLPDFYLPTMNSFLEVKPCDVDDPRYGELGLLEASRVFLVNGNLPDVPRWWSDETELLDALRGCIYLKWPDERTDFMLAREAQGRINLVPIAEASTARGDDPEILQAYVTASSHRFAESE